KGGDDQAADAGGLEAGDELQAAAVRQAEVGKDQLGAGLEKAVRLREAGRDAADLEVRGAADDVEEMLANRPAVLEHADAAAVCPAHAASLSATGRGAFSTTLRPGPASSKATWPPIAAARERRLPRPWPRESAAEAARPRPLSAIAISSSPGLRSETTTSMRSPPECFMALVTASCMMRKTCRTSGGGRSPAPVRSTRSSKAKPASSMRGRTRLSNTASMASSVAPEASAES